MFKFWFDYLLHLFLVEAHAKFISEFEFELVLLVCFLGLFWFFDLLPYMEVVVLHQLCLYPYPSYPD